MCSSSNYHDNSPACLNQYFPPETWTDLQLPEIVGKEGGDLFGQFTVLVEIDLPMDGTWSVYVHGWQTAGPSADYDMYSWIVSATPGGNMTIDSAPASATQGATEAIDISWTGATAGQWHLGAVSHTGDTGLIGLTLVEVDNR